MHDALCWFVTAVSLDRPIGIVGGNSTAALDDTDGDRCLAVDVAEAFYQETAAEAVPLNAPQEEAWFSMDEHDDTPQTEQRWRALFTKVSTEGLKPPEVDATYRRR